jgi:hypothetical protein
MPDVTRIIEQKATESIYNDDWVMIDRPTEGEDGGTRKILVSRLKELLCGDYIADEWVAGETYTNGAIVSHEGKLYYNNSGGALVHTTFNSNSWLEVKIDELLEKVISSVGEKWRRVDTYHYDDLVVYGGRLYRCIKNASTQGTWVSNEWIEANAEYYFKKVREYIARYGFIPSGEAISSPYNKGDLILYRAPGDTTNSLYMRLNDTEYGDPTWIPENWLKVENIGGALSKIYDDMEESSCDIQIKEQSIIDENNVADLTSLAAVGSASGAIASFDDGSDLPMPKLEVAIEPQQDLHGYDSPWVGGAGKNKVNQSNYDTLYGCAYSNGKFIANTISNFAGGYIRLKNNGSTVNTISKSVTEGERVSFTVTVDNSWDSIDIGYLMSATNISANFLKSNIGISSGDITISFKATKLPSSSVYGEFEDIQIELGTTATTFAPYSNICPISGWDEVNVVDDAVYGGFINWNQLVQNGNFESTSGWGSSNTTQTASNNVLTITKTGDGGYGCYKEIRLSANHKLLKSIKLKGVSGVNYYFNGFFANVNGTDNWQTFTSIFDNNSSTIYFISSTNETGDYQPYQLKEFYIIDLTQLFGETKANEIYAMEQAEAGSGVAYFKSLFYKDYYPYNSGEITNVSAVNGDTDKYHTYTIDLDGTRYGGTLDAVSGKLTVDRVMADMGDLTWTYYSIAQGSLFRCDITNIKPTSNTLLANCICSQYSVVTQNNRTNGTISSAYNTKSIDVIDNRYSDASTFKTAMNGVQLVYKLATPITYQLTPTQVKSLLGTNNVWADTGDVLDAEYIRDATTIINSLIARIEALENQ